MIRKTYAFRKTDRPGNPGGKRADGRSNRLIAKMGLFLLAVSFILQVLARKSAGFGQWYAVTVYPLLVGSLGRFCSLFPFSLAELSVYLLLAGCLVYGIRRRDRPFNLLSRTFFLISLLFFLFTVNCGINYYRLPFSRLAGFEVKTRTGKELAALCDYLTEQVNLAAAEAEAQATAGGEAGGGTAAAAVRAMEKLGERYPCLAGYYPRPKRLLASRILSVQQLAGIYSPFTVEANYNGEMTPYNIPHTACHELSHLRGFMREDEANFIGFLACVGSDDAQFRYSGWALGWIYAGNALAGVDREAYAECYNRLSYEVKRDYEENSIFWGRFDTKVAEAADKLNDTYLKANSQSDGTKSYGRAVDLMLAWYATEDRQ